MAPPPVPAKKKKPLRAAALLVLPMLAGAALGVLGALYFPDLLPERRFSGAELAATAVAMAALLVAVVAIHEAGHLLGGRLAGFRALLFVVGPFRVERTGTGIRASLNRSAAVAGGWR